MPRYTIVVKKGDIVLEVSTADKEFIEKEFAKWVLTAADVEKNMKSEHRSDSLEVKKDFIKPDNPLQSSQIKEHASSSLQQEFQKVLAHQTTIPQELTKEQKLEKFRKKESLSQTDAFMKCVYELSVKEKMERFSFSQVNVLAEEQFGSSFNYEIIQKAIDLNYIKIVPDYTGMANVVEYALAAGGERYFENGNK